MSYVPGFDHDVFVSYCHDDDFEIGRASGGWIAEFRSSLQKRVGQLLGSRDVDVWIDQRRLDGVTAFDEAIEGALQRSAALLAVVSPLYLTSEYCSKERDTFLKRPDEQIRIGSMRSTIRVVKTPADNNLHRTVFDGPLGFELFDQDGKEHRVASPEFVADIENICQGLERLLKAMWCLGTAVYFGHSGAESRDRAKGLRQHLHAQGFRLLPVIQTDRANLAAVAKPALETAVMSIHLFGKEDDEVARAEAELAMEAGKPMLTWVVDADVEAKTPYGELLRRLEAYQGATSGSQFLNTPRAELVKSALKDMLKPSIFVKEASGNGGGYRSVYVVCDTKVDDDYRRARKIRSVIEDGTKIRVDLPDAGLQDPQEIRSEHERKINRSDGLLLYWGDASPGWFSAVRHDLERKDFVSRAVAVGHDLLPTLDGETILKLGENFSRSELAPFLNPLT